MLISLLNKFVIQPFLNTINTKNRFHFILYTNGTDFC